MSWLADTNIKYQILTQPNHGMRAFKTNKLKQKTHTITTVSTKALSPTDNKWLGRMLWILSNRQQVQNMEQGLEVTNNYVVEYRKEPK